MKESQLVHQLKKINERPNETKRNETENKRDKTQTE